MTIRPSLRLLILLCAVPVFAQTASVNLAWNGTAAKYNVYRSTTSGQYSALLGSSVTPKYVDSIPLGSAQQFFYVVRSFDGKTESANSNEVKVSIPALPPTVTCILQITGANVTGTCQ